MRSSSFKMRAALPLAGTAGSESDVVVGSRVARSPRQTMQASAMKGEFLGGKRTRGGGCGRHELSGS